MIHAYNDSYLSIEQDKLGLIFELAILKENINLDDLVDKFLSSPISKAFEKANPIYVLGYSANELLAKILNIVPKEYDQNSFASPEYWLGYVLAYAQWYLNKPFSIILENFKASKILANYFPYHEMDISQITELIKQHIPYENKLKSFRNKKGYSQSELAFFSNVPIRNIRAYEQGKLDISKAQADTLYYLSKALGCTIEDLIK